MIKSVRLYWDYILMFFLAIVFAYSLYAGKTNITVGLIASTLVGLFLYLLFTDKNLIVQLLIIMAPLSISFGLPGASKLSFPTEMGTFILFIFAALLLLSSKKLDKKLLSHPITILLFCDLLIYTFSTIFSTMPVVSIKRLLLRIVFIMVYYFVFYEWHKKNQQLNKMFILYAIGIILPIFYTSIKHSRYDFIQPASYIMSQPFYKDHTIYGACLAFILPFLVYWLINSRKKIPRIYWFGVLIPTILIMAALLISYSRASWISVLLVLVFYFFLKIRLKIYHLIGIITLAGVLLFLNFDVIYESIRREDAQTSSHIGQHLSNVSNLENDASNLERINRWVCALRMFQDKPLSGFGPGTYQFQYGSYQSVDYLTRISTYSGNKGHAHSEYLSALAETGIFGFIQLLVFVFYTIHLGMKLYYRHKDNTKLRIVIYGALSGLLTFFIHSLFNGFLDYEKMAILVYGSLALLVHIDLNIDEKDVNQTQLHEK
jgi:putative inorganic carbon (HCO3(-)) transporter